MDALTASGAPDVVRQVAGAVVIEKPAQSATVATPSQTESKSPVSAEQAKKAVDSANEAVRELNSDVEFAVDDDTGINVVKVVEKQSDKVIRQLPIEAVITFARVQNTHKGLLFTQKV